MKPILSAVVAVALLSTGCVVVQPRKARSAAAVSSSSSGKKCPPGHTWSDGRCHDTGKGHDPAKHQK
jgi:hypothetical protein